VAYHFDTEEQAIQAAKKLYPITCALQAKKGGPVGIRVADRIDYRLAGTEPAERINPAAVAAMNEIGIDITAATPKVLTADTVESSDVVITMGCGDTCPYFPGVSYRDWKLDDPAGQPVEVVRRIRDDIAERVRALVEELLKGDSASS
jgi:arsenate reductase